MDLKNYKVQPDEGLFEKIERRLRRRRLARVAGGAAAACVVAAAVVWMAWPSRPVESVAATGAVAEVQLPAATAPRSEAAQPAAAKPVAVPREAAARGAAVQPAAVAPAAVVPSTAVAVPASTPAVVAAGKPAVQQQSPAVAAPAAVATAAVATAAEAPAAIPEEEPAAQPAAADKSKGSSSPAVHEDNLIWAPNVIVPHGDEDKNRTFRLHFTSAVTDFRIVIFNRGGRQVYQSNDPAFEWDGTYDGAAMPQGAYVWVAKFRDSAGRSRQEKGTVTIIR